MAWRGRGGRSMAPTVEHRSYDEYDDAYAATKARGGRPQQQQQQQQQHSFGDRGQRFDRPPLSSRQHYNYHDDRVYVGPQGEGYGQQGWMEPRQSRAPYSTNHQRQPYEQHWQQPDAPQRGPLTERGTRWSGGAGGRFPSGGGGGGMRAPGAGPNGNAGGGMDRRVSRVSSSSGGGGGGGSGGGISGGGGGGGSGGGERQPSAGRSGSGGATFVGGPGGRTSVFRRLGSGGGGSSGSGGGGGGAGQTSSGRTAAGRPPSGGSGSGARASSNDRSGGAVGSAGGGGGGGGGARGTSASTAIVPGNGSGRVRAPYVAPVGSSDPSPALPSAAADPEPDAPSNPNFITPAIPQAPRTRTDSCNMWAVMVEAGCQTLEAVVGPFLEGAMMELFGEAWERELFNLELKLPPFSAATCAELVSRCKQLHERLPITIHKRVEAMGKAVSSLASSAASLEPEDVTAAHTAMKGMMQDCVKAMKMPSLLGSGSRQWRAFTTELMPHAESMALYYDMLLADCSEAAAARQQVRAAAAATAAEAAGAGAAGVAGAGPAEAAGAGGA